MPELPSRRAFLTRAWRDALAAAPQVKSAVLPGAGLAGILAGSDEGTAAPPAPRLTAADPDAVRAGAVTETVTTGELLVKAAELGLEDHGDSIASLALQSVRLVPGTAEQVGGRSSLGDPLIQIDLAELSRLGVSSGLPDDGLLRVECDISEQGPRWRSVLDAGVRLTHVPEEELEPAWSGTVASAGALLMSVELTLPRVWSAPVEALGLDETEQEAWQELRLWLARRQGVELFDQVDGQLLAHRLFGYPDERTGEMPLICELAAAWAEFEDHPHAHPLAPELEPLTGRWKLLLQLSAEGGHPWPWAERGRRLYFWIDEEQLEAGDLSSVVAVAQ